MVRLTRAQQQDATRRKVLAAAKSEFAQRGFRGATVDGIAERADMTRGAVYSNFPGKRALYLAVLAHEAEQAPPPAAGPAPADTPAAALGAFASTWLEQLPQSSQYEYSEDEQFTSPALSVDFVPEVLMSEQIRRPFAQLLALDALLLAASLRAISQPTAAPLESFIASAESVLTILYGTTQLSYVAPEFTDPARAIALCEQVALLGGVKTPTPPAHVHAHVTPVDEPWEPPSCTDRIRADSARLDSDGLIAVLGMHRIGTIEAALSIWPEHTDITLALVSDHPAELAPLARLAIADICRSLRHAFPAAALPRLQVIVDDAGTLAAACGFDRVEDNSELAVIVENGHITARAEGRGAAKAAATAYTSSTTSDRA
ncbi:helix-turn-helix domain-containing protein [Nocardia sp. NPDC052112]|uniref:TetR/AcrR family transcriptional regulator n=1 Tax=Nocardia sp. NPDC052112 TaxID=3155646 RepID=UPI0034349F86